MYAVRLNGDMSIVTSSVNFVTYPDPKRVESYLRSTGGFSATHISSILIKILCLVSACCPVRILQLRLYKTA